MSTIGAINKKRRKNIKPRKLQESHQQKNDKNDMNEKIAKSQREHEVQRGNLILMNLKSVVLTLRKIKTGGIQLTN